MAFGPWANEVVDIARRYGLDPFLFAGMIQQESGWNPQAIGDHGHSVGLGQFNVNGALKDWNLSRDQYLSLSPVDQLDLAARQLANKTKQADGDPIEGLRLYNGGGDPNYVNNVLGQIKKGAGIPARSILARQPKPKLQAATMFNFVMPDQQPPAAIPDQTGTPEPDLSQFLGPPMMADRPLDPVQRLMNDPLTHIGLGILATPTGQGSWLQGVARGTLAGMQAFQAQQRLNAEIEDTLERQRQRAARKELEIMRLKLANSMPGLDPLMRNLLVTDPSAFAQIYSEQLRQKQQQQQAAGYRQALGMSGGGAPPQPELGTAPPQGMPGGGAYPPQPESGVVPPQTLPPIELPPPDTTGAMPADQAGLDPDLQQLAQTDPKLAYEIWNERRSTAQQQRFQQQQADIAAQREAERNAREQAEKSYETKRKIEQEKPDKYFEQTSKLRAEYESRPEVKEWASVQRSLTVVPELYRAAQNDNSKVADIALITAVGNAQDPQSVVMEGERIAIQKSGGLVDEIKGYINYFNNNGRLEKEMRADLVKTVQRFGQAQARAARARQEQYTKQAKRYNFDPIDVVGETIEAPPVGYGLDIESNIPPPPPGYRTVVNPDGTFSAEPIEE